MKVTKIALTLSAISALEILSKALKLVSKRDDLRVFEVNLNMVNTNPLRQVWMTGNFGNSSGRLGFNIDFVLEQRIESGVVGWFVKRNDCRIGLKVLSMSKPFEARTVLITNEKDEIISWEDDGDREVRRIGSIIAQELK